MDDFHQFVLEYKQDLRNIAKATRGEHQYEDVVNEAWIMAKSLSSRMHMAVDYSDPTFRKLLFSHLFQHLVRYTELNVRHATRLDHGTKTEPEASHPLMNKLKSDDGRKRPA